MRLINLSGVTDPRLQFVQQVVAQFYGPPMPRFSNGAVIALVDVGSP
jgi:hypothetical protein